ncbi:serine/threonine protein kinase Ran1 [Datura stramonium]|uniref:Serine/threonine protein kinase Ran1 n=1 Tax=Datura stramonium TaxID=4076 RepID=A0ABS8VLZ6_DATST|nr:serine/threonine protein kinase Ran1 [Datura stramonium]
MAPNMRDVQLTVPGKSSAEVDIDGAGEEVRLLDSYEEENLDKLGQNLRRIQVRVTGMTCAACSTSVEGALMGINGVVKASVALLQNKADVVFDPSLVKVEYFLSSHFFIELV